MCYNPRHIVHPSNDFDITKDSPFLTVPCGRCGECENLKRESWCVRTYYEFLKAKALGGYTLFLTMTYNDKCLPKQNGFPCFSKRDIVNYLKRVRNDFIKVYGKEKAKSALKYIITSEYGGKTCRPHYHALFFVESPNIPINHAKYILRGEWTFGFTKFSDKDFTPTNRGVVTGLGAIVYVTKYITKDVDFHNQISQFYSEDEIKEIMELKNTLPFHLQSTQLGTYAIDWHRENGYDELLQKGMCILPKQGDTSHLVAIPEYLDRKIYYDVVLKTCADGHVNPTYVLTDEGAIAKMKRLDIHAQALHDTIDNVINNHDYVSDCRWFKLFNSRVQSDFTQYHEIAIFLKSIINKYNSDFIVYYALTAQGYKSSALDIPTLKMSYYDRILKPRFESNRKLDYFTATNLSLDIREKSNPDIDKFLSYLSAINYANGVIRQTEYDRKRLYAAQLKKLVKL